jgi:hypothetical protein
MERGTRVINRRGTIGTIIESWISDNTDYEESHIEPCYRIMIRGKSGIRYSYVWHSEFVKNWKEVNND